MHRSLALITLLLQACTPLMPLRPDAGDGGSLEDGGAPNGGGSAGGGSAGGGSAGGGVAGGGMPPGDAERVSVTPGSGRVGACVALAVQPVDSSGNATVVRGGPVSSSLSCVPPLTFFGGASCIDGPVVNVSLSGPAATAVSTSTLDLVRYECAASAAPPLLASPFTLEGHAALRVELTSGASELTRNRCIELRVRSVGAAGGSVFMPAASAIALSADGGQVGRSPVCDDLGAGVTVTIPAGGSTALFYARTQLGSTDGGALVTIQATPQAGVLADESNVAFPSSCLPTGTPCRSTPGACCVSCSVGTDTCT